MSVDALSWAFRLNLPPIEKLVMLSLADRANQDGRCWPSHTDTMERTGLSDGAVRGAIRALRKRGLLERRARVSATGAALANMFELAVAQGWHEAPPPRQDVPPGASAPDDFDDTEPGSPDAPWHGEAGEGHTAPRGGALHARQDINRQSRTVKEPESDSSSKAAPRKLSAPPEFEAFWRSYPRKVGKGAASKAFLGALKKASAAEIMAGLARAKWSPDPQFIPHPATWLNQERWRDEQPPAPAASKETPWRPGWQAPDAPPMTGIW